MANTLFLVHLCPSLTFVYRLYAHLKATQSRGGTWKHCGPPLFFFSATTAKDVWRLLVNVDGMVRCYVLTELYVRRTTSANRASLFSRCRTAIRDAPCSCQRLRAVRFTGNPAMESLKEGWALIHQNGGKGIAHTIVSFSRSSRA
jgi:hypothetical protein